MTTYTIDSPELTKVLNWVAKAQGTNDRRAALNCIHIDGGKIIASDGKRMHLCPVFESMDWEEGSYTYCKGNSTTPATLTLIDGISAPGSIHEVAKDNDYDLDFKLKVQKDAVSEICAITSQTFSVSAMQDACGFGSLLTSRNTPEVRCQYMTKKDGDYFSTPLKLTLPGGLVAIVMPFVRP